MAHTRLFFVEAHRRARVLTLALGLGSALALAGCGRKGPVELPPGAPSTPTSTTAEPVIDRAAPLNDNPGLMQPPNKYVDLPAETRMQQQVAAKPKPITAPPAPSSKPFLLDPLIQ